jgi:hypothetical protein
MMFQGLLSKMKTTVIPSGVVAYRLPVGEELLSLNHCLGQTVAIRPTGNIFCVKCGRKTKKSFQQGYCFPCARSLPETDMCMMKPELCHFAKGTCRDATWGLANCMRTHTIYLANASGLKVGITRNHPLSRWADQGATQGLAIATTGNRLEAGQVEVSLKSHVSDRTNWRKMLKGTAEHVDLVSAFDSLKARFPTSTDWQPLALEPVTLTYPILEFPDKIASHNLDHGIQIAGTLLGIKGQYLIFDTGVMNVRKFSGYEVQVEMSVS